MTAVADPTIEVGAAMLARRLSPMRHADTVHG